MTMSLAPGVDEDAPPAAPPPLVTAVWEKQAADQELCRIF